MEALKVDLNLLYLGQEVEPKAGSRQCVWLETLGASKITDLKRNTVLDA